MINHSPFRYFKTSPEIIRLAVMIYVCYPFSLRSVEDLLHERGVDISHETIRFWWTRFGPLFAVEIRKNRVNRMRTHSNWQWHLDEIFVKINGETHYLWQALDHPHVIVTDLLRSYGAAMKVIGNADRQEAGRWLNNRAENSHPLPDSGLLANHEKGPFRRRERAMLRFRRMRSLQKIRLRRRLNSQSFQPRTSPLFTCQFQA
jgi:putative transposase